jgi:hypothetical protein
VRLLLPCYPAAESRGEPFFEKGARFCALHPPPHGVHHAAAYGSPFFVKTQPVGKVQFHRLANDGEALPAQFEKALLKNHAQNFPPNQFPCARFCQRRPQKISRLNGKEFLWTWQPRKFQEIERAIDRIQCKPASLQRPAQFIACLVKPARHIGIGNASEGPVAHLPELTSESMRRKCLYRIVSRGVRFQTFYHHSCRGSALYISANENRSTTQSR